jgi:hypothetical protein
MAVAEDRKTAPRHPALDQIAADHAITRMVRPLISTSGRNRSIRAIGGRRNFCHPVDAGRAADDLPPGCPDRLTGRPSPFSRHRRVGAHLQPIRTTTAPGPDRPHGPPRWKDIQNSR